jgi:hypothetical protein
MSRFFSLIGLALGLGLVACGGGGGNAGNNPNIVVDPVISAAIKSGSIALTLVDGAGSVVANRSLSQTDSRYLRMVLTDSSGAVAPYGRVTVTLDSANARLVPAAGAALTDGSGVLLMRITPTDVTAAGPVLVTATASLEGLVLTKTLDLQIAPGTVSLTGMSATPLTVQNGQSVNVSVNVLVNGAQAASNALAVAFTSGCGTVSPASSLVDGNGRAMGVIQTVNSGNCSVLATAAGGVTSSAAITVTEPITTDIRFVSATPAVIYQAGSVGAKSSIVSFKVINASGAPVQGQTVTASLTNTDGGINFCDSPTAGASGADGLVTFSVCAGTLPANVQVRASLLNSNPLITTGSNLLTIQTGVASQRFFDLSANKLNMYAGGQFTSQVNGNSVDITAYAADRQGNPVPDGTKVIFVSEGGQINSGGQSSCTISSGSCTVRLIGQAYRPLGSSAANGDPRPGRVTVLAFTDGEEYFIDANNNNRYDAGEFFEDLGLPYLDKDESRNFVAAYTNLITGTNEGEVSYPLTTGASGAQACPANSDIGLSVAGTCNGTWDGNTKVRRSLVVIFSGDEIGQPGSYDATIRPIHQTEVLARSTGAVTVRLSDYNGNPLPAEAVLTVQTFPAVPAGTCSATLEGATAGSTTEPTQHTATLKNCVAGDMVRFTATVSGKASSLSVVLP